MITRPTPRNLHSAATLVAFEERVKDAFLAGQIRAPVHLSGGNEGPLIAIFHEIKEADWVFSTWRNHYHALLKGVPEEELFQAILAGRSMYCSSKEHKFISSSIVGGILPIACGVAMGAKRLNTREHVWAFIGDMTAETGIFAETVKYCGGHDLPITFVVEDNGLSTNTPTRETWGIEYPTGLSPWFIGTNHGADVRVYHYERTYPHVGVGQFVEFG